MTLVHERWRIVIPFKHNFRPEKTSIEERINDFLPGGHSAVRTNEFPIDHSALDLIQLVTKTTNLRRRKL